MIYDPWERNQERYKTYQKSALSKQTLIYNRHMQDVAKPLEEIKRNEERLDHLKDEHRKQYAQA